MLDPDVIQRALTRHPRRTLEIADLRPAAVILPLFVKDGVDHVLFTRRTETLRHHRGEISFPGGAYQPSDGSRLQAALRETEEEMGIAAQDITVLGKLDDVASVHGYHVVPFVGSYPYPYPYRVNADEIAEVIELPLERLRDPAVFRTEEWRHQGRLHPVYFYTVDEYVIWGLTARILHQFLGRVFTAKSADGISCGSDVTP
ncbi:MAG TPA: CoA pyrophosphatase [Desulfuromonadales bacterium]|nr:CoA pyrophosphatase [Desulfuromonadales bacterium]